MTFSTVITKCGPQPRFENYTINSDGWELVQYSPCYWNMGFVNFNEQPHAYSNGTWTPVKATKILPHQPLATIYNHEEALYLNSKQLNNPGYGSTINQHMNILADIAAAINEHSPYSVSNLQPISAATVLSTPHDKSTIEHLSDWFDNFLFYLFIVLVIIAFVIAIRILYCCGAFSIIYILCCKFAKKDPDMELSEMRV